MDSWAEEVLAMAKRLPRDARLRIAEELRREQGGEADLKVEEAWRQEVLRRMGRYLDGQTAMLDGEAVYQSLRSKYAG